MGSTSVNRYEGGNKLKKATPGRKGKRIIVCLLSAVMVLSAAGVMPLSSVQAGTVPQGDTMPMTVPDGGLGNQEKLPPGTTLTAGIRVLDGQNYIQAGTENSSAEIVVSSAAVSPVVKLASEGLSLAQGHSLMLSIKGAGNQDVLMEGNQVELIIGQTYEVSTDMENTEAQVNGKTEFTAWEGMKELEIILVRTWASIASPVLGTPVVDAEAGTITIPFTAQIGSIYADSLEVQMFLNGQVVDTVSYGTAASEGTVTFQPSASGNYTFQAFLKRSGEADKESNVTQGVTFYSVAVEGSYAQTSGAASYVEGATVSIDAGTRSGYTFAGWTSRDGVAFADADSAQTTFIMPDKTVTVTANWTKSSSGTGNSGDDRIQQVTSPQQAASPQQVTSPQTGDDSNTGLYVSLCVLSFSGLVGTTIAYGNTKRRRKDEKTPGSPAI